MGPRPKPSKPVHRNTMPIPEAEFSNFGSTNIRITIAPMDAPMASMRGGAIAIETAAITALNNSVAASRAYVLRSTRLVKLLIKTQVTGGSGVPQRKL